MQFFRGKCFWLGIILLVLSACSNEKKIPKNVIDKEQMISILIDVYLAEAKVKTLKVKTDSAAALYQYYEQQIFKNHGVTDSQYLQSYQYYLQENLKAKNQIDEAVLDSLNLRNSLSNID